MDKSDGLGLGEYGRYGTITGTPNKVECTWEVDVSPIYKNNEWIYSPDFGLPGCRWYMGLHMQKKKHLSVFLFALMETVHDTPRIASVRVYARVGDVVPYANEGAWTIDALEYGWSIGNIAHGGKIKWKPEKESKHVKLDCCITPSNPITQNIVPVILPNRLFLDSALSDVEIQIRPKPTSRPIKLPAHKAILASRSEYFLRMFSSGMKEAIISGTVVIEIDEYSVKVVKAMLEYLYTGRAPQMNTFQEQCDVLRLADQYQLTEIFEQGRMKMSQTLMRR